VLYFAVASLAASHWVYDRSGISAFHWFPHKLRSIAVLHVGVDEASTGLRRRFPEARIDVYDFFDAATMTERSILQARVRPDPGDPLPDALAAEAVFCVWALHELRQPAQRQAVLRRIHALGSRIVIVEHLRDLANFAAFGPGAFHFHSLASWRADFRAASLTVEREVQLTPFVRAFILI
jgi:hypothetical protein